MNPSTTSRASLLAGVLGCLSLASACSSGGGSSFVPALAESEPNDTSGTAALLALSRFGHGAVDTPADVDFWRLTLVAGTVIRIELLAARIDQSAWDANDNVARLTLFDTDGTTKLLEHDLSGNFSTGWSFGQHDLDVPLFRVPSTGTYFVAVTQDDTLSPGGEYALRVQTVDMGTLQGEAEAAGASGANDTFGTAESIEPGVVHGFHVDGESDFYSFTVTGPSIARFELTSHRNGVFAGDDDYFDGVLNLFDTDGTSLLLTNDDTFFADPAANFHFLTAGTYFVEVAESVGAGDAAYFLTFTLTETASATIEVEINDTTLTANAVAYGSRISAAMSAADSDFFAFTGEAGDMVRVEVFDGGNHETGADAVIVQFIDTDGTTVLPSDGPDSPEFVRTILQADGTYYVRVLPDGSPTSTPYVLDLQRFDGGGYETEGNDTIAVADVMDLEGHASGIVGTPGDVDVFAFAAGENTIETIVVYADDVATGSDGFFAFSGHGSTLDPLLRVLDATGTPIAIGDSAPTSIFTESVTDGLPTAAVSFLVPATGTYYVEVSDTGGGGSATHHYMLTRR